MKRNRHAPRTDPFKALAASKRRKILTLLRRRQVCSAGEIAREFPGISRPAISRHLRVLRQAGLVRAESAGREQRYQADAESLGRLQQEWLILFSAIWDGALSALKEHVEARRGGR